MGWRKGRALEAAGITFMYGALIKKIARITRWFLKKVSLHNGVLTLNIHFKNHDKVLIF